MSLIQALSLQVDICSFCNKIDFQLKKEKRSLQETTKLSKILLLRNRYTRLDRKPYQLMRETYKNNLSMGFLSTDLTTDQKSSSGSFYLHQLRFYALCLVHIQEKNQCSIHEQKIIYQMPGRDSSELSPARFHYLKCLDMEELFFKCY